MYLVRPEPRPCPKGFGEKRRYLSKGDVLAADCEPALVHIHGLYHVEPELKQLVLNVR